MIVYPNSYIAYAIAAAYPSLKNTRIGYETWTRGLEPGAITATEDDASTPKDAPTRPGTAEFWQPFTLPDTWVCDFGTSVPIDYIGIAAHTLGSADCSIEARLSDDREFNDYLRLQSSDGNFASSPDASANSITGDLHLELELTVENADLPTFSLDFLGDYTASMLKITGGSPTVGTFTRAANTATRINSNGLLETVNANIDRQDFDPVTRAPRGILIEEARTNLILQSEDFSTTWTNTNVTLTTNAAAGPTGANVLDLFTESNDGAAALHHRNQALTKAASSVTYACSLFVRDASGGNRQAGMQFLNAGLTAGAQVAYNLATGALAIGSVFGSGFTFISSELESYGGGLYRMKVVFSTDSSTTLNCRAITGNAGSFNYQGNGSACFYAGAMQVEAATAVGSYIGPTAAASITRNADTLALTTLSAMGFNASEGTIVVNGQIPSTQTGSRRLVEFDDNTVNERIAVQVDATNARNLLVSDGGVTQANVVLSAAVAKTPMLVSAAYKLNDFAASADSGSVGTDASGTLPSPDRLWIGRATDGAWLNGWLGEVFYYSTRRDNARLQDFSRATYRCLASKWNETANQRSWSLCLKENGALVLFVSTDGTAAGIREFHSAPLDFTTSALQSRFWLRVKLDLAFGSPQVDSIATFEYSVDDRDSWNVLSIVTQAQVAQIFDSTAQLEVGSFNGGTSEFEGRLFQVLQRTAIDGAIAWHFDAGDASSEGATTIVSSDTGETWTIGRSGSPAAAEIHLHQFSETHDPADDSPIMLVDSRQTRRFMQISVLGEQVPDQPIARIAVINAGRLMAMPRAIRGGGFVPMNQSRETTLQQVVSRGGQFLGQNIRKTGIKGSLPFTHLAQEFVEGDFDDFILAAREFPFFVARRPETHPAEVAYAWATDDIRPQMMGVGNLMQVTIPYRGIGIEAA